MKKKQDLSRLLSAVLVLALLLGLAAVLRNGARQAPENPIRAAAERLEPENGSGSGGGTDQSGNGEAADETEDPQEDPPDEEPPQEEPETPEQQETPDTEEPNPDNSDAENPGEDSTVNPDLPPVPADPDDPPDPSDPSDPSGPDNPVIPVDPVGPTDPEQPDPEQPDVPDEPETLRIVTSLRSPGRNVVRQADVPDGSYSFDASIAGGTGGEMLLVRYRNSGTSQNGTRCTGDGTYGVQLVLGELTTVTMEIRKDGKGLLTKSYVIYYEPTRADQDNPSIGDNPPSIVTNMDGYYNDGDIIENQTFILRVTARTNPAGGVIRSNQITVKLNGQVLEKQTGDADPEYELFFERSNVGDYRDYTIEIIAWDGTNSSYWRRTVRYHAIDEGDYAGTATVVLDATTVSLGILDTGTYEILQGETVADIFMKFVEEYGYEATCDGSTKTNFYLRRLSRGDMAAGAEINPAGSLPALLERDGIDKTGQQDLDSLGEYDFTMGSGWMYSVNGGYPGRGLSAYPATDGMVIYVRFTLCYGKDIGGYDSTGGGYGKIGRAHV